MTALPWLLLASALLVRLLLARRNRRGWWLDIVSVPAWAVYYAANGDWPLVAVPIMYGVIAVQALRRWWR